VKLVTFTIPLPGFLVPSPPLALTAGA